MQLHVSNQSVRVKDINNQLLPPTHPPTHPGFQYNGLGTNNSYSAPKYEIVISICVTGKTTPRLKWNIRIYLLTNYTQTENSNLYRLIDDGKDFKEGRFLVPLYKVRFHR